MFARRTVTTIEATWIGAVLVMVVSSCSPSGQHVGDGGLRDAGSKVDSGQSLGCANASDCDDGISCTSDICNLTGACSHAPVPALCPVGALCSLSMGCVAGRPCGSAADCTDSDPCTRNEACDSASATCTFTILDNDGDGEPPRVCGGTDCDDADAAVNAAAGEICGNLIDDNCNGVVDSDATLASDPRLRYDEANCGTCGTTCYGVGDFTCYQGTCIGCGGTAGAACCNLECTASTCDYAAGFCGTNLRCADDGNNGSCEPCGTLGGACCKVGPDAPCGPNARCDFATDTCIACGAPGQPCCANADCAMGADCTAMPSGDVCVSCGHANEACCAQGTACTGGVACFAGTCKCGGELDPCCAGTSCTGGRVCEPYSNTSSSVCHSTSCGGPGEPCCGFGCFGGASCVGTQYGGDGGVFPIPGTGTCTP